MNADSKITFGGKDFDFYDYNDSYSDDYNESCCGDLCVIKSLACTLIHFYSSPLLSGTGSGAGGKWAGCGGTVEEEDGLERYRHFHPTSEHSRHSAAANAALLGCTGSE